MRFVQLRWVPGWALTAGLAAAISGASLCHVFAEEPPVSLTLPPALEQIARIVKPRADETRWSRIPWLTDLAQGQRLAREEHRPLFVFVSGDEPLEAC